MFDFKKNRGNSVPRASLYCVWIHAYPDKDAPLIRVWIDPAMSMFESQATVHQADLAALSVTGDDTDKESGDQEAGPGPAPVASWA